MTRMTAWMAPMSPAHAVSYMQLLAAAHLRGARGRGVTELSCLLSPFAVSPQVGAALYATGAVQRRVLTRTGECSAPAGLAGCCRQMGKAVLVRGGQGACASVTCGLGH